MNALINCLYCGGDAHGTPGVYKRAGEKQGHHCGFCSGTGKVRPEQQFSNWKESAPRGVALKCKDPYRTDIYINAFIVLCFVTGAAFLLMSQGMHV